MIEMIGVLAIIGVLSVGGIAGYSKAMAKYKLTKVQDQLTIILMNIRSAYATSVGYPGLTTDKAREFNIIPADMISQAGGAAKVINPYGGGVIVKAVDGDVTRFSIEFNGLKSDPCARISSSDWKAEGLVSLNVNDKGEHTPDEAGNKGLPISLTQAYIYCQDDDNSIIWTYY